MLLSPNDSGGTTPQLASELNVLKTFAQITSCCVDSSVSLLHTAAPAAGLLSESTVVSVFISGLSLFQSCIYFSSCDANPKTLPKPVVFGGVSAFFNLFQKADCVFATELRAQKFATLLS